jgi:hypothetical protein
MKAKIWSWIVAASGLSLLWGCGGDVNPLVPGVMDIKDRTFVSVSSATRHTMVAPADSKNYSCAEPPPDAAFADDDDLSFGLSFLNFGSTPTSGRIAQEQAGLGGRSPNVLMVREMLFRMCEFFINSKLTPEQKVDLYKATLDAVAKVGVAPLGPGTPPTGAAVFIPQAKPPGQSTTGSEPSQTTTGTDPAAQTTTPNDSSGVPAP